MVRVALIPLTILLSSTAAAEVPDWADLPAFEAPVEDLVASAEGHDEPVWLILLETDAELLDEGELIRRVRWVYQVNDPGELESWMNYAVSFQPEIDEIPTIDARVIGPDGEVRRFDPTTLVVEGADRADPAAGPLTQRLRVVLPGPEAGAIVEVVHETRTTWAAPPELGLGLSWAPSKHEDVGAYRARLTTSLPVRGAGPEGTTLTTTHRNGRYTITADIDDPPPVEAWDAAHWTDRRVPLLELAVDTTPARAAEAAQQLLAPFLEAGEDLDELTACAAKLTDRTQRAGCLLDTLNARVQQRPMSISATRWRLRPRAEVLETASANPLEATALYLAMARHVGLEADLVTSWGSEGSAPQLPPLAQASALLVRLGGPQPIFVDVQHVGVPVGHVHSEVAGHPAIVLSRQPKVITLPRTLGGQRSTMTVDLRGDAGAALSIEDELFGWTSQLGRDLQLSAARDPAADTTMRDYFHQRLGQEEGSTYETAGGGHASPTFTWSATASHSDHIVPGVGETSLHLWFDELDLNLNLRHELFISEDKREPYLERTLRLAPVRNEATLRLLVPEGFVLADPPAPYDAEFDGVILRREVTIAPQAIELHWVLDASATDRIRYQQLEPMRDAIRDEADLARTWRVTSQALALFEQGHVTEAVQLARASVKTRGDLPSHTAWAAVLDHLGLRQATLRILRELAAAHPESAVPQRMLAASLSKPPLGEDEASAEDLTAAFEATERALAADPSDATLATRAADLARQRILESWDRPGDLARWTDALKSQLTRLDEGHLQKHALTWALAMDRLGRDEQLRQLLDSDAPYALIPAPVVLAVVARDEGLGEMLPLTERLYPSPAMRSAALVGTSALLMMMREHDTARLLLAAITEELPSTPELDTLVATIGSLHRWEVNLKRNIPMKGVADQLVRQLREQIATESISLPMPGVDAAALTLDLYTSMSPLVVTGSNRGTQHILIQPAQALRLIGVEREHAWSIFTARSGRHRRLLGTSASRETMEGVAIHFYEGAVAGDPILLDLVPELAEALGEVQRAPDLAWLRGVWPDIAARDPEPELLFTTLVATAYEHEEAIDRAASMLDRIQAVDGVDAIRWLSDRTQRSRPSLGIELLERQLQLHPDDRRLMRSIARAWRAAGVPDKAEAAYRRLLERAPEDDFSYDSFGTFLLQQGRLDEARALFEGLAELDEIGWVAFNNHAWFLLLTGHVEESLELVSYGARRTSDPSVNLLHTWASALAMAGRTDEAWELVREVRDGGRFTGDWWFPIGRIAESLDLREAAIDAYRQVPRSGDRNATWFLAAERLEILGEDAEVR